MTPTQETADIRTLCDLAGLRVDTIDGAAGAYTVAIYPPPVDWRSERLTGLLVPGTDWTVYAGKYDDTDGMLEQLKFERTQGETKFRTGRNTR